MHIIYALLHKSTEPASKVTIDAFTDSLGENARQFVPPYSFIPKEVSNHILYKNVETKFHEALFLYSAVVPWGLIDNINTDLRIQYKHCSEMVGEGQSKERVEMVGQGILDVIEKLTYIEKHYKKQVDREIQRNDFSYEHMKESLHDLGFVVKGSMEQCSICLYGKSLVDMYFYKDNAGIRCAVLQTQDEAVENNEEHVSIIGGVTEFKIGEGVKTCFAQIFADMVRVGTSLAYEALITGEIINKITVYGLLVNYKTKLGYSMKYEVDFTIDQNSILFGSEIDAVKAFMGIIQTMNNC